MSNNFLAIICEKHGKQKPCIDCKIEILEERIAELETFKEKIEKMESMLRKIGEGIIKVCEELEFEYDPLINNFIFALKELEGSEKEENHKAIVTIDKNSKSEPVSESLSKEPSNAEPSDGLMTLNRDDLIKFAEKYEEKQKKKLIGEFLEKITYYLENDVEPIDYFIELKKEYEKKL